MCTLIYNLTDYSILICPRESTTELNATTAIPNATTATPNATTATPNTTTATPNTTTATPNTTTAIPNATTAIPNATTATPNTTTATPNATTAIPNATTATPNTTTATPNTTTSPNTTDIHNTSSTTKDTINTSMPVCAPCTCHEVTVPSPSIDIVKNFSNNTHRHGLGSSVVQDLSWLHAFWAFVPLVAILCYCRIRKKICARMRVGFIKERYTRRSKSWPTHERAEHPARVPRSKSSFDTVVL